MSQNPCREPLIKFSADCVAGKMRMDARRATKVVACTTKPRSATTQTPYFAATRGTERSGRMTLLFVAGLASTKRHSSRLALHPIANRRNRVGFNQRFLNLRV